MFAGGYFFGRGSYQDMLTREKRQEEEMDEEMGTYHVRERSWGRFNRSFTVPHTIDPKAVKAEFANGVLTINLPKAERARRHAVL